MSSIKDIMQSAIQNIQDTDETLFEEYNFSKLSRLSDELAKSTLTVKDLAKWEFQIALSFATAYKNRQMCPRHIDPNIILLDANYNIIYETVIAYTQKNCFINEVRYIDCIINIHSLLFANVYKNNIVRANVGELAMFHIMGNHYYSICGTVYRQYTISTIVQTVTQMYEMVNTGLFKNLIDICK